MSARLPVQHFTDLLCVWAYACQVRVDELVQAEGEAIGQLSELGLDWTKYGGQGSGAALRADKG